MNRIRTKQLRRQAGLGMLEVVVSTFLVAVLLVTALTTLGAATQAGMKSSHRAQAALLASDLMDEILQQDYLEPDVLPAFGTEGSGERTGNRAAWDDVDDYDGWTATPPQEKDGTVTPLPANWNRQVTVNHVDPDNLKSVLADGDDQGVKRIRVTVYFNGQELALLEAVQTTAWLDMIPNPGDDHTTGSTK